MPNETNKSNPIPRTMILGGRNYDVQGLYDSATAASAAASRYGSLARVTALGSKWAVLFPVAKATPDYFLK